MANNGKETFLPALANSFNKIDHEQSVSTADFAAACERILPIFDHLGAFLVTGLNSTGVQRKVYFCLGHAS